MKRTHKESITLNVLVIASLLAVIITPFVNFGIPMLILEVLAHIVVSGVCLTAIVVGFVLNLMNVQ